MLNILNATTKKLYKEFNITSYIDTSEDFKRDKFYVYITMDNLKGANNYLDRRKIKLNIRYFPPFDSKGKPIQKKGLEMLESLYLSYRNNKVVVNDRYITITNKDKIYGDDLFIFSMELDYFIDSPNYEYEYDLMKEIYTKNN